MYVGRQRRCVQGSSGFLPALHLLLETATWHSITVAGATHSADLQSLRRCHVLVSDIH